jgi:tetratricopeptide (TPR) repeat protein
MSLFTRSGRSVLVIAGLTLATGLLPLQARAADEDAALRQRALQLNDVTGKVTMVGEAIDMTHDPAKGKQLLAAALRMAKENDQVFTINATYILALVAVQLKDVDASQFFFHLYAKQAQQLQSGLQVSEAYLTLAEFLFKSKEFAACEKVCHELIDLATKPEDQAYYAVILKAKKLALEQMSRALAMQGKSAEALKIVDGLIKEQPENWLLLDLKGQLQQEAGSAEEALKTYETLLDRVKKDKAIGEDERTKFVAAVRYTLSGVYVDLNQIDKAADQLKTLLDQEPNNPTYNNDLGYIWADHDMNLEESEKLIRKALEEERKQRKNDPDLKPEEDRASAAYIDSLGWVLFKQKKYDEAKKYLLQAVETKDGQHVEIYEHLGDVYMALGDKAKAVEAWKKGVESAGSSKREQQRKTEVEKKLKTNE